MALVKCKECGNDVSSKAATCPKCGVAVKPTPKHFGLGGLLLLAAVVLVIVAVVKSEHTEHYTAPESPYWQKIDAQKAAQDQRAAVWLALLKKSLRDPDSFKLASALVVDSTGAVCYEYRARNGFGGMNTGQAVLASDHKTFRTSETDGFSRLWNRECAGKSGHELAPAAD